MKGTTVLKIFLVMLAAVFVVHQCVSALYNPVKTESAIYYTSYEGINITGVVIRNEILVTNNSDGVLHFITNDGSRVAKNGVIADIYDDESASITLSEMESIKNKIRDIKDLMSYNDLEAADLELITSKVNDSLNKLVVSSSAGDFLDFSDNADELLSILNRRQAAMGNTVGFSENLAELEGEFSKLSNALPTAKGSITAKESGYFVSKADGYENILTCENFKEITPEFLDNIKAEEVPKNVIGKIVSDYEWYVAAKVSVDESLNYKVGDSLKLYTSVKSYPEISVTVKEINKSENGESAVLLFECNDMNNDLAALRNAPMTVVKKEYSGLKVSRSALRVVDSKRGVYVLSGMKVKFVPVNIIFSNDSYVICEKQIENSDVLRLYDEVIVKGKKLYDGKIIG